MQEYLTSCFIKINQYKKQLDLVRERLDISNGHPFFYLRMTEIERSIGWYEDEIYAHRTGWWRE